MAAGPSARKARGVELQDRGALHEIEHGEARGEARAARRRQHVVRAADIVADHLGRVAAEKDRAGIADAPRKRFGVVGGDLEMLRREAVDQRRRLVEALDQDDGAEIAPARARRSPRAAARRAAPRPPRRPRRRRPASSVIRIACAAASCSAWASRSAAIQAGSLSASATTTHLRRPGDHVDADLAEHLPLGGGDVGVARPDDLVDRGDALGAVGKRRDRLGAADAIDLVDAGELGRRPAPAD